MVRASLCQVHGGVSLGAIHQLEWQSRVGFSLMPLEEIEVLVAGGGNAALCSALSAREAGARVTLLERDVKESRGGNSKYTRNIRCLHPVSYPESQFLGDLLGIRGSDEVNTSLAKLMVNSSIDVPTWMEQQGVRWQAPLEGSLQLNHSNRFFLGGGKALINTYYRRAEQLGVEIHYGVTAVDVQISDRRLQSVTISANGETHVLKPKSLIVASGGFESNLEWLRKCWGAKVDHFIIRGTSLNDGLLIEALLRAGAKPCARPDQLHAVAVDARSPAFDGGIVTRIDAIPVGIVVNKNGERFSDEGADLWPKRYASWGLLIAEQPDECAFVIFDTKAYGRFIPSVFAPVKASSIGNLATQLDIGSVGLEETVASFNQSVTAGNGYDLSRLDGNRTVGIDPPKSNWALPLLHPPYYAYPVRPGITFTYSGLSVDDRTRVIDHNDLPFDGVFAAGEAMAGNILNNGYLAGIGMTIGTVFGRIAGQEAARYAQAN